MKATIFGATGYAGAVLTNLISNHPNTEIHALMSSGREGMSIRDFYPGLNTSADHMLDKCSVTEAIEGADVIFTALPHGKSIEIVTEAHKKGKKVIDLSADFRLNDAALYEKWYETFHPQGQLLVEATYGLPEVNGAKIKNASIIANPGCYPTSILLGLAPLMAKGVEHSSIVINSMSGVSGAGRNGGVDTSFVEVNENLKAYKIGTHRHTPEINQELGKLGGGEVSVSFSPHLVPVNRGILSTMNIMPTRKYKAKDLVSLYQEYFANATFVKTLDNGSLPQTKWVNGSNYCYIGFSVDERTGRVVVVSAIDNLMKGAAGQAVQNMNLMFGLPENAGLMQTGIIP